MNSLFFVWLPSEFTSENHILQSGYLELGELNRVIMLFPQVLSSEKNGIGCWDSFGYSGTFYGKNVF